MNISAHKGINISLIKQSLKLLEFFASVSDLGFKKLLEQDILSILNFLLLKELSPAESDSIHSGNFSLFNEVLNVLISFFPQNTSSQEGLKIFEIENKTHFIFLSKNILSVLLDNIAIISSTNT
jgi:hypothetical protein